ncbi:MAG: aminopeptidase P family protein [Spirochaetia bacterium]|jgi:Xaa-Pro aminopeptidase|nr:aminopeptidase P family protein [Spirochaetia bacterium]
MTIDEKVKELRTLMAKEGLDAYFINGTGPHNSEYVCDRWKTRQFITGFTGSAGTVVVTADDAVLWVDSRYFIQGAHQIEGSCFHLIKEGIDNNPGPLAWLVAHLDKGAVIGISADTLMLGEMDKMQQELVGLQLRPTHDLLSPIWKDRPSVPEEKVVALPEGIAGETRAHKLQRIRQHMQERQCSWFLLPTLDDIAWTMNLRGQDIEYNPVFMAYLLIGTDSAYLFTSRKRFTSQLLENVEKEVKVLDYDSAVDAIGHIVEPGSSVLLDRNMVNTLFSSILGKVNVVDEMNVTTLMKACKNEVELEGERKAHLLDGIALINFLSSLDYSKPHYDEAELADKLNEERLKCKQCVDVSFGTIAGYQENGAMCHYRPTHEVTKKVTGSGLLVLDSGGQYEFGTTDVTRTLLFGEPTAEQKRDYTLVLKGNLALARQKFPEGTRGIQLDVLAKQYLWQEGLTFYHGTGHGVGHRLCVHEGPQRISSAMIDVALKCGMVTSDEPGLYIEGKHGIRIENLLAVKEEKKTPFGQFLGFEVLTLYPFERRLIDVGLLSDEEIAQIDTYHARVRKALKDRVEKKAVAFLLEATEPLKKTAK